MSKKRIGVLTSGGDCAGLNACIRSIVLHAKGDYNWDVFGIRNGTLATPVYALELDENMCSTAMMRSGGTMLGSTNRSADIFNRDGSPSDYAQNFVKGYQELGLDALIGIGGDGSMKILRNLAQIGNLNLVTIPKTIDNDLGHTEKAIGFTTAVEVATEALDRLQATAASHQRVMILEVMGRDAGHIALNAGLAGGADVILIPEIPYSVEGVCDHIKKIKMGGRNFALIVVAESVKKESGESATVNKDGDRQRYGGIGHYLNEQIEHCINAETRVTVLGHVQRGGQPSAWDRIMASALGMGAVDLIYKQKYDHMVAWSNREIIEVPIQDAIAGYQAVNKNDILVKTAQGLGIYVGKI
ncbi:MAG: 6-phosphofructokinase [Alphaproteobacteria bacterium CG_4_10_14_0_8_um_filter_37_21]|nr:MAG: 6-phosphofructokinase [Alphaproteobacteria bacterium CG_4_10_14_0_8_um_filter_37_21]